MSIFDVTNICRGPAYAVGYGVGHITALWKVSRDLSSVGCPDDSLAKSLGLELEHVQAARELMGPHDKRATAVLRLVIGDIVTTAYQKTMDKQAMEKITKTETIICKALIVDPDGLNYLPIY